MFAKFFKPLFILFAKNFRLFPALRLFQTLEHVPTNSIRVCTLSESNAMMHLHILNHSVLGELLLFHLYSFL